MADHANAKAVTKFIENKNAFLAERTPKYQQYWHGCHQSFCRQSVFQRGEPQNLLANLHLSYIKLSFII
jgi:hypothetical protein